MQPFPLLFEERSFDERLKDAYRQVYAPPMRGDIWDYLEKYCVLPHSVRTTKVRRETAPWIVEPVRAICRREKREQTVLKPVQGAGTTIIDLLVQWIVTEAPGETWLNMQKKEAADDVAETRFIPLLEKNERTAALLPRESSKKRKTEIVFDHMLFKVQGATKNNLQSKSVPWMLNDEVWLWADKGLLTMARMRITAVWNGTVVNISQGSVEDDHLDLAWQSGEMHEWGFRCPKCKRKQQFIWMERDGDGKVKPGGIKWEDSRKRESGEYDLEHVLPTVHYECKYRDCKFRIQDTLLNRRALADVGDYTATNSNFNPVRDSWRWNAMTVYWIEWKDLFQEWAKAQEAKRSGNFELLKLFIQQRLAQFWQNRQQQNLVNLRPGGYSYLSFTAGTSVPDERLRLMTIDFQRHNLWVCIRAWKTGILGSMLLRYEYVRTFDDARRLQEQYKVRNEHTLLDLRYNTAEGARQITRWQEVKDGKVIDWSWTGVMGEDRDFYVYHPRGQKTAPVQRPFSSFNYSTTEEGLKYRYLLFSNLKIKDILSNLRSGKGYPWEIPDDIPEVYKQQLDTEYRALVEDKAGAKSKPRWLPIKKGIDNHSWDTEVQQTLGACITGCIKYSDVPIIEETSNVDTHQ